METFTQSEITMWDDCPEKHHRAYTQQLEPKNAPPNWSFVVGSAVHDALDRWRCGRLSLEQIAALQLPILDDQLARLSGEDEVLFKYWTGVVQILVERYIIYYATDKEDYGLISTEQILRTEFMGVMLEGKLDWLLSKSKKICLVDTKTTSRYTKAIYDGWQFKFQFMFYIWLLWKAKAIRVQEFWADVIIKPQQKRKKDESTEALLARIRAEITQEPDKTFKREPLLMHKNTIERFEKYVLVPKITRILLTKSTEPAIVELLTRNKNDSICINYNATCPFLPLCEQGDKELFRYSKREHKHEELVTLQKE